MLFMANDWHASLVPAYLAAKYRRHGVFTDARSVLAIHNLSHQGVEVADHFGDLGLPGDWCVCLWCCLHARIVTMPRRLCPECLVTAGKSLA